MSGFGLRELRLPNRVSLTTEPVVLPDLAAVHDGSRNILLAPQDDQFCAHADGFRDPNA